MNRAPEADMMCAARVRQFVPDIDDAELAHRVALMKARDHAAALRARTRSPLAADCATFAHDLAGRFVFLTGESSARLEEAVQCCRSLVTAAMRADSLNSPETPL
jgi:hypothetical protein